MTTDAVNAHEPADDFDLEAWLAGARPPARSVTVYGRADLVAELEALEAEYDAARTSTDRRLGGPTDTIRERIREVRSELDKSRLTVRLASLSRETVMEHAERFKDASDGGIALSEAQVAAAAVDPVMTEQQVQRLRERIGWGQFTALANAVWEASNQKQVTAPFSRAISDDTTES